MESKMNEFREFVKKHPLLRDEVKNGKNNWQNVYEEWILYGAEDTKWNNYSEEKPVKKTIDPKSLNLDNVKNVLGYVKKINPDNLNKTLNNVQKVIQIAQTVGGGKSVAAPVAAASAFSDWWD